MSRSHGGLVAASLVAVGLLLSSCREGSPAETSPAPTPAESPTGEELPEGTFEASVSREDALEADVRGPSLRDFPVDLTMTIDADRLQLRCGPPGKAQEVCVDYAYTATGDTLVLVDPDAQVTLRLSWDLHGDQLSLRLLSHSAESAAPELVRADEAIFASTPWTRTG